MSSRDDELLRAVARVTAAYVGMAEVPPEEIGGVIGEVARSFRNLAANGGTREAGAAEPRLTPARIRKSITPDALISFEDGRPYKILKRHLAAHGLTPQDYRTKWGLPFDYPMVAPNQSAARSQIARRVGFWKKEGHGAGAKAV